MLFPSSGEFSSLEAVEAMACGTPPVISATVPTA